jgi:hypothetical protein
MWFEIDKKRMLKSILHNKTSISIDKLISEDKSQVFLDPEEVKEETKRHFETWTKNPGDQPEFDQTWQNDFYKPIKTNERWFHTCLDNISVADINEVLKKANNNSAPGHSQISYVFFKNLGRESKEVLAKIFTQILTTKDIPKDWQRGWIYPIPKRTDWEFQLKLVRPITLLETGKKIFTKILTNRISQVLIEHNILQENNWAGLPGGGTNTPITILKAIIEDAKENQNSCYIVSQDMSKAYDSMLPSKLHMALTRIGISKPLSDIILNLNIERTNQVITKVGLTRPYVAEIGIDQGDSLSPLMWRIYYDPLITKINQMKNGYQIRNSFEKPGGDKIINQVHVNTIAYMDDTTWITENPNEMEKILKTANEFYQFTNLKLNWDKSTVIAINPKTNYIKTGQQQLRILPKHTPVRFLGTWNSGNGEKTHQINLMKQKITSMTTILKRKRCTDKEFRYIINHVLMPALEFLMQDMVIPARECENMNSMIIKFFKNKTNLATTAINSGIHWKEGYNIYHILDRQIQGHSKRILKALNNKDLKQEILLARLQAAQNTSWSTTSILDTAGKTKFKRDSNLMGEILQLLSETHIKLTNVESHNRIRIPEYKLTLKEVMGDNWFQTHRTQLKKNRIMYVDQLANITGKYLLA